MHAWLLFVQLLQNRRHLWSLFLDHRKAGLRWTVTLRYLYQSWMSNRSQFFFINIRPLLASILIILLLWLSLHHGLIEWPEVTMLVDWVKIILTQVTRAVIILGMDLFDGESEGPQRNLKLDCQNLRFDGARLDLRADFTCGRTWDAKKRNPVDGRLEVCLFWFESGAKPARWKSINITLTYTNATQRYKQQI